MSDEEQDEVTIIRSEPILDPVDSEANLPTTGVLEASICYVRDKNTFFHYNTGAWAERER